MDTMTKTQSVSATKLAVATAVLLAAGGLALATMPAMQSSKSAGSTSGANLIKVSSCEQKGADIEISRNNGPKYILKAGCKNAGSGFKDYTFECVKSGDATSTISAVYKVSWTPCATFSVAADNETYTATGGVVTVGANKLLAVFNFSAYAKDAIISSLVLTKIGTVKNENLTNIKLTDANGSMLANPNFSPLSPDKLVFTFNKVVPFGTGMPTKLMVSADILGAAPGGDTLSLGINSASDIGTGSTIEATNFPVTYGPVKVMGAAIPVLYVTWAMDTPSGGATAPSPAQIVGKLKFSNSSDMGQEAAKITSLAIDGASTFPVSGWKLYKDSTSNQPLAEGQVVADGTSTSTFKVVFSNFEVMVGPLGGGSVNDKTFFITADTTAVTKIPQTPLLVPKNLSITVKSVSDIGSSVAVKDNFPLSWKTFVY